MYWKIFTDANTPDKAKKIVMRTIEQLSVSSVLETIEPYHKGGFVCTFSTFQESSMWSEVVLQSLNLAQKIGCQWILAGSIKEELNAWSNDSKLSGVQSIHLIVERHT